VPLCVVPPVRNVDSELVCPNASNVMISFRGQWRIGPVGQTQLLASPVKFSVISYC